MGSRQPACASRLSQLLDNCAAVCKETLSSYLDEAEAHESTFGQALLAAIAAVQIAARHADAAPHKRNPSFAIAVDLCRTAAQECRRHGLDEPLLRAAAACDDAAWLCASTQA